MNNPCDKNDINGFSAHGSCCCNCQFQQPINAHPWNKDPFVKGKVTEIIGYGCLCPEFFPDITFMEDKHSLCECWTENTYRREMTERELERDKERVWEVLTYLPKEQV